MATHAQTIELSGTAEQLTRKHKWLMDNGHYHYIKEKVSTEIGQADWVIVLNASLYYRVANELKNL